MKSTFYSQYPLVMRAVKSGMTRFTQVDTRNTFATTESFKMIINKNPADGRSAEESQTSSLEVTWEEEGDVAAAVFGWKR